MEDLQQQQKKTRLIKTYQMHCEALLADMFVSGVMKASVNGLRITTGVVNKKNVWHAFQC